MGVLDDLKALDKDQRSAFMASFLGWTLDAFDFFLLTFVIKAIAADFHVKPSAVQAAIFLTLVARPFGALFFGWLADKFGRRPVLMADVMLYSLLELGSAFAPSLITLLVLRTMFGFVMGGEWGIGASLALESIPARSRGVVSGILQEGYAVGQLLGALVFAFAYPHFSQWLPGVASWRVLFAVGVLPALLVFYIRRNVKESPSFERTRGQPHRGLDVIKTLGQHWKLLVYAVALMACFNFFSHGTQDNYATFLEVQHGFKPQTVGLLTAVMNLGAIAGGLSFGAWSERIGRRRAITNSRGAGPAHHSTLGLRTDADPARPRRLPAADRGAGRLGRCAGAPQRALAGRCARDLPWRRLPVRQPDRRLRRAHAGPARRGPADGAGDAELRPGAGGGGRGDGGRPCPAHLVRTGGEGQVVRDLTLSSEA